MFCITFIVGIVIFYAILWPVGMPSQGRISMDEILFWNPDLFALLRLSPIFVFAFACHPNLFVSLVAFLTIVDTQRVKIQYNQENDRSHIYSESRCLFCVCRCRRPWLHIFCCRPRADIG
jgi:hypothetical protein